MVTVILNLFLYTQDFLLYNLSRTYSNQIYCRLKKDGLIVALIIIFALIQGVTEFIPVSSQGHLIFFNDFFNVSQSSTISILQMNIIAHMGSLLAVVFYYRNTVIYWIRSMNMWVRPDLDKKSFLLLNIIVSSTPVFVIGYFFAKYFNYDNELLLLIISLTSIIFGILIYIFDKFYLRIKNLGSLTYTLSFYIGLSQCLALIPGVSRSGSIITSMRLLGFRREFAVEYSNLLSIPVILGAVTYLIIKNDDLIQFGTFTSSIALTLLILSFIFSFIFLLLFIKWVRRFSFSVFAIYRVLFGLTILGYFYM